MRKLCGPISLLLLCLSLACARGQLEPGAVEIQSAEPAEFDLTRGTITATNVLVRSSEAVLTANRAFVNTNTGDIFADGSVRVQKEDQTWTGEHLHYNYLTGELDGEKFRTGKPPMFALGEGLHGSSSNHTYTATNTVITADDYYTPFFKVRAKYLKIVPGQYFEARQAVFYADGVPFFYLPYYRRGLGENQNNYSVLPGYSSSFGPFLLGTYNYFLSEEVQGRVHLDYREKRGPGAGPDFALHLGDWGNAILKYYYTHDMDPGIDNSSVPIPNNRQRFFGSYAATPWTNMVVKGQIAYWSDPLITHDFFESEYVRDIQPKTFFEANQLWQNWSLDPYIQPRVNPFFDTVMRLPDVRLTGYLQQIGDTPFYYQSQSSVGWYRRVFSDTNLFALPFSAARADTFHQITLPETFFGFLNVIPRVGGRFTYYTEAEGSGATTAAEARGVFNTGVDFTTKLSRTWPGLENHFLDLDGLRHIIEPSIDYVYVPTPNVRPPQLPQFDYLLPNTFYLLPIDFPDFNDIDAIDSMNVIRWGLRNRLQTKRKGQVVDLLKWDLYLDWRLKPLSGLPTFSDVFSTLELRPRDWLSLATFNRYDINTDQLNLSQNQLILRPNNTWNWAFGYLYLRGSVFGTPESLLTSTFYYRFDENWGARIQHIFDATSGTMQQQYYTIYRDLRSWTAGLTLRVTDDTTHGTQYTVAVTFSLKALPRFGLGQDSVSPPSLIGY